MYPSYRQSGWTPSEEGSVDYFQWTLVFCAVVYLFETYLDIRQHRRFHVAEFPVKLKTAIKSLDSTASDETTTKSNLLAETEAKFSKSRFYGLDKSWFSLASGLFMQVEAMLTLLLGLSPYVWEKSDLLLRHWHLYPTNASELTVEILQSLLFLGLIMVYGIVLNLPFEMYSIFVVEEKHGFNKQTLGLFISDKIKTLLLSMLIGAPLVSILISLIRWGGEYFYLYVWFFLFCFAIVMLTIYPVLIMPLFNKFDPLESGELRTRIEALAARLNFPLTKLFVCDGSKRSSHSNAYFYGFMNSKRIVLFDTLLKQATNEEIVAILGHELGHWRMWHVAQGFLIQQLYTLVMFFVFGLCMNERNLFASFGYASSNSKPVIIGLILFSQTVWAPIDKMLSFLLTMNTRRNEFQADAFAVNLGYPNALQSGLTKLSIENLSNMNPDPLYSAYHYSHPPLLERLEAINELVKKQK